MGGEGSVFHAGWPVYDESHAKDDLIRIPVQVNGKTRTVLEVPADMEKAELLAKAKEAVAEKITGTVIKEIYVPGKIVNLVVK